MKFIVCMSNKGYSQGIVAPVEEAREFKADSISHLGYFDPVLLSKFFNTCKTLVDKGGRVEIGVIGRTDKAGFALIARPAQPPNYLNERSTGFCMVAPVLGSSVFNKFGEELVVKDTK